MNRGMVEDKEGRVDFGMAEALAFGSLALHRGVRPPHAMLVAQQKSTGEDLRTQAQRGMHHAGCAQHLPITVSIVSEFCGGLGWLLHALGPPAQVACVLHSKDNIFQLGSYVSRVDIFPRFDSACTLHELWLGHMQRRMPLQD